MSISAKKDLVLSSHNLKTSKYSFFPYKTIDIDIFMTIVQMRVKTERLKPAA